MYLKECPRLNERPFRMSALFTAEKFNERPGLNDRPFRGVDSDSF